MTGELPAQRARNTENVSIWWRHHVLHFLATSTSTNTREHNPSTSLHLRKMCLNVIKKMTVWLFWIPRYPLRIWMTATVCVIIDTTLRLRRVAMWYCFRIRLATSSYLIPLWSSSVTHVCLVSPNELKRKIILTRGMFTLLRPLVSHLHKNKYIFQQYLQFVTVGLKELGRKIILHTLPGCGTSKHVWRLPVHASHPKRLGRLYNGSAPTWLLKI